MTPRAPSSCLWCFERNGTDWNGMERNGMERNGTYQVPMRCYGDKPSWFRKVSPSGAVPVANIDGRVISESNVIMQVFGICAFSFVCVAESAAVVLCMKIGRKFIHYFCLLVQTAAVFRSSVCCAKCDWSNFTPDCRMMSLAPSLSAWLFGWIFSLSLLHLYAWLTLHSLS